MSEQNIQHQIVPYDMHKTVGEKYLCVHACLCVDKQNNSVRWKPSHFLITRDQKSKAHISVANQFLARNVLKCLPFTILQASRGLFALNQ